MRQVVPCLFRDALMGVMHGFEAIRDLTRRKRFGFALHIEGFAHRQMPVVVHLKRYFCPQLCLRCVKGALHR